MYRKSIFLISFVLVLGLFITSTVNANADIAAYWKFDDGSGTTAFDSSGNGHDGTLEGDPQWVDGQFLGALEFNGSSDYVNCGTGVSFTTVGDGGTADGYTISVWINPYDPGGDGKICGDIDDSGWAAGGGFKLALYQTRLESDVRDSSGRFFSREATDPDGLALEANTWYHVAIVYDDAGDTYTEYINGEVSRSVSVTQGAAASTADFRIGTDTPSLGHYFNGIIDEVRIYSQALTEGEIQGVMAGAGAEFPYASKPYPADGSLHPDTWVSMSWRAGDFAVSHDVYFGDNFDDVNDGLGDTFRGNQGVDSLFFIAGFFGFPFPDGLVNGTTYYWRIDEVNDADPNSPWKGDVWSFTVPPKKAYNPAPVDNAAYIAPEALTLNWMPGFGAKLHTVYFSDDFDTVANATGGTQQGTLTYDPGPLEAAKTYYWRVDEFDGAAMYTGDVWSFTTAKVGGGVRGDYYKGMNFENFVLTRTDTQINFNWGDPGNPDPAVGDDNFSARWTGEVEVAFTETYTFYATGDDGIRLWVDGQQLVDGWVDQGATEYRGTIDLVAGQTYSLIMEYYENTGGTTAELRWSSPSTPKQLIPQAALSPPIKASSPSPANGATGTKMTPILLWGAGDYAESHELYFGTDAEAVANATNASPEYKGTIAVSDESYDPGKLAWFTEYFWRVDEVNSVNPESPWVGNLWSFTTGDFLVVDNFEDYDAGENQIWYAWHDGLGYGAPGTEDYFAGNGTGAAVGDETTPSYTEETIVHGGSKSMPLTYENNKQGYAKYSETELTLTDQRDWTEEGVTELSLWFRGYSGSVGSFAEGPAGTYTITGSGADIWDIGPGAGEYHDEFHFAYKMLTGPGSIVAKVESVENTNVWAKAAVMIRETLDGGSKHALAAVTPASGVAFQGRTEPGAASFNTALAGFTAPYWVKLERDIAGYFSAYHSANGSTWELIQEGQATPIPMTSNVYVGMALTSHDTALTCQAVFSNVTTTGTVSGQWANQDIGITSNDAEPLYVAVSNSAGTPAVVVHDDPAAATIDTWTEWVIPLQTFADQGINLSNVDKIAIGLGTQGNMTIPGGSGKMYIDDIRLYQPREVAE